MDAMGWVVSGVQCLTPSKTRRVSVAQDPPKKGVAEAVVDAQKAGVKARNRRIEGINTLVVGSVQADRCS